LYEFDRQCIGVIWEGAAIMATRRVGIYLRVSTDGQTTENQRRELEAVAARTGWEVVAFYEDAGISGSNGREKRPGLDRMLKDATARRINMIAAWSVDRLGRSLQHLVELLNELEALHCNLYQHQQATNHIDPTAPEHALQDLRAKRDSKLTYLTA
jgi:DNA invertase Pin-like site-specific DNA recombinase